MQIQENPPIWCFKVLSTDATGQHTVHRTNAIFQRPRDAKRAAMVWAVNFAAQRRFSARSLDGSLTHILIEPQVFRQRR